MNPHPSVQGIALEECAAPGRLERFGMPGSLHLLRLDAGEGVPRPVELGFWMPESLRWAIAGVALIAQRLHASQ